MNVIRQLFGQTALYGLGIVMPRLLNYIILTPFYTRIFAPGEYAVITELYAYVLFLIVVLTYGMETGYFRFSSSNRDGSVYSSILSSVFTTSLLFVLIVFVLIRPISGALEYAENPEYIRWLALIVALDAFSSIPFARLRLENRAVKYAIIRVVEVMVNIGLNLFFLLYAPVHRDVALVEMLYNPELGVGYVLIANLVASSIKLLLMTREILAVRMGRFNIKLFRQILAYSLPLLIAGLAGTVNEALDRVLLKHLVSPEAGPMYQLGIYGANYKIAVLMTLFIQMFKYAAEPFFFSKSETKDAKGLYADVLRFFVAAGLLIFLGVMFYIDLFKLFIGSDFREGIAIVPVILLANLMMGIFFNLSIWYKLSNRTIAGAILVSAGALITVAINVAFIPKYGYIACAWGHLASYTVMVILSFLWSRKHYAIPYKVLRLLGYIALTLALFVLDVKVIQELQNALVYKTAIFIFATLFFIVAERKNFKKYTLES